MGTGEAQGDNRAEEAARKALTSPLLGNVSIHGATGILYNITAASNLSLKEIGRIAEIIKYNASTEARIKFGIVDDDGMGDVLRVTVIATGFREGETKRIGTRPMHRVATPIFVAPPPPKPQVQQPAASKQDTVEPFPDLDDCNRGYYLGSSRTKRSTPANITGYVNESSIPNMMHDPECVDDLLDVPSFQRPKLGRDKK